MQKTKIEWVKNPDGTQGYSWNPIKGLCPVGCWYCYGKRIYERFRLDKNFEIDVDGFGDTYQQLRKSKKPLGIFVCSTYELFHKSTLQKTYNGTLRDEIFAMIEMNPQHRFYILTKFPENIDRPMPDNVWLGVTVTGDIDIWKVYKLLEKKNKFNFISIEPFLNPIYYSAENIMRRLNWIIVGALTGKSSNKNYPIRDWVDCLVAFAKYENIPIFLKNNLRSIWGDNLIQEMPE